MERRRFGVAIPVADAWRALAVIGPVARAKLNKAVHGLNVVREATDEDVAGGVPPIADTAVLIATAALSSRVDHPGRGPTWDTLPSSVRIRPSPVFPSLAASNNDVACPPDVISSPSRYRPDGSRTSVRICTSSFGSVSPSIEKL